MPDPPTIVTIETMYTLIALPSCDQCALIFNGYYSMLVVFGLITVLWCCS